MEHVPERESTADGSNPTDHKQGVEPVQRPFDRGHSVPVEPFFLDQKYTDFPAELLYERLPLTGSHPCRGFVGGILPEQSFDPGQPADQSLGSGPNGADTVGLDRVVTDERIKGVELAGEVMPGQVAEIRVSGDDRTTNYGVDVGDGGADLVGLGDHLLGAGRPAHGVAVVSLEKYDQ